MQNLDATGHRVSVVDQGETDENDDGGEDGARTPNSEYEGGQNGQSPGKPHEIAVTATVTADSDRVSQLQEAHDDDENAPLLGGKQIASPT